MITTRKLLRDINLTKFIQSKLFCVQMISQTIHGMLTKWSALDLEYRIVIHRLCKLVVAHSNMSISSPSQLVSYTDIYKWYIYDILKDVYRCYQCFFFMIWWDIKLRWRGKWFKFHWLRYRVSHLQNSANNSTFTISWDFVTLTNISYSYMLKCDHWCAFISYRLATRWCCHAGR